MKSKRVLAFLAVAVMLAASLPLAVSSAEKYATVTCYDLLHLRDYPGTEGEIIGRYRHGTKVEILKTGKLWVRVRTPDGKEGYMFKDYLSAYFTDDSSNGQKQVYGNWYVKSGVGHINFRKNPNGNSRLLDQIDEGTMVTMISTGDTWSAVMYNGTKGWVKTKYLTKKKP